MHVCVSVYVFLTLHVCLHTVDVCICVQAHVSVCVDMCVSVHTASVTVWCVSVCT